MIHNTSYIIHTYSLALHRRILSFTCQTHAGTKGLSWRVSEVESCVSGWPDQRSKQVRFFPRKIQREIKLIIIKILMI